MPYMPAGWRSKPVAFPESSMRRPAVPSKECSKNRRAHHDLMPPITFRLLLVTDRHQTQGRPLPIVIQQAVKGGVPAIQVRERDLSTSGLLSLVQEIRAITAPQRVSLIVNDRVDLVLSLDLEGVH